MSRNASGESVKSWDPPASFFEVWAQKEDLVGRELFVAQQIAAKTNTRFRIRYVDGVTPRETLRIVCDGRDYDITAVSEIGRREGLEILAWARAE